MPKKVEGRGAGQRSRPSGIVSRQSDAPEIAQPPFPVHRLASRFGLTPAVAATIAELAYPKIDTWSSRA